MNFINLSNHPSSGWGEEQKQAAKQWGTIIDYPFPEVDAQSSTQNIKELAEIIVISVLKRNPSAIMCQGEMTLTYQLVKLFKEKGLMLYVVSLILLFLVCLKVDIPAMAIFTQIELIQL